MPEIYTLMDTNLIQASLNHPVVIFDGECHLCDNSVQFVLKRDKKATFRFCTLQHAKANNILPLDFDSVILLDKNMIYVRSKAALKILNHLGGGYRVLSGILSIVPTFIADKLYNVIAKHRYKWFGKYESCIIPDPKWKDRFIP